jgi:hypothetical protein
MDWLTQCRLAQKHASKGEVSDLQSQFGLQPSCFRELRLDVRYGSLADVLPVSPHVRFVPIADIDF